MGLKNMFSQDEPEIIPEKKTGKSLAWKTIRTMGKNILIEYQKGDIINRVILPVKAVTATMTEGALETGVQYGLAWARVLGADSKLENDLRKAGIWDRADFIRLHQAARGILKIHKVDYAKAMQDINKFNKKDGGKTND